LCASGAQKFSGDFDLAHFDSFALCPIFADS